MGGRETPWVIYERAGGRGGADSEMDECLGAAPVSVLILGACRPLEGSGEGVAASGCWQ